MQESGPDSIESAFDSLYVRLRPSATQPQTLCKSDSDLYNICVQKKNGVGAELCGSSAAEEGSGKLQVLIELSHDLKIIRHNPRISPLVATFKH